MDVETQEWVFIKPINEIFTKLTKDDNYNFEDFCFKILRRYGKFELKFIQQCIVSLSRKLKYENEIFDFFKILTKKNICSLEELDIKNKS